MSWSRPVNYRQVVSVFYVDESSLARAAGAEAGAVGGKQATMELSHRFLIVIPAAFATVMATMGLAPAALASHGGTPAPAVTATPHVTATISVGSAPYAIAADPSTGKVYVTNSADGTVSVINGKTNKVIATIPGFYDPRAVAVNPRTGRVYVTWYNNSSNVSKTSVISEHTDKVIATISGVGGGEGIAVNPRTDTIYTGDDQGVAVINGRTDKVVAQVKYSPAPLTGGAVNPRYNRVFFGEGNQESVVMINGYTNKVITHIPIPFPVTDVAVDPRTNLLYVADYDTFVQVLNARTGQFTGDFDAAGNGNQGIAVNPQTHLVYVTSPDANVVTVVNGQTGQRVAAVSVAGFPFAVAVNPATGNAYVADQSSNTVSVIAP
jgi:YVTN family beta-propeller protein